MHPDPLFAYDAHQTCWYHGTSDTANHSRQAAESEVHSRGMQGSSQSAVINGCRALRTIQGVDGSDVPEAPVQVQQIQDDLVALLTLGAEVDSFAATMDTMSSQYTANLQATNFQSQMDQLLAQSLACKQ